MRIQALLGPAMVAALAVLAALVVAVPAAAHITTTFDPLTAPLEVGVPTVVTVHFSEPCFEVPANEAPQIQAGLTADAPSYILWEGESVPFTADMCEADTTGTPPDNLVLYVRADAKLTLTATAAAPGLTNFTLPVTSYQGSTAGEVADPPLTASVAYFATGTFAHEPHEEDAGHGHDSEAQSVHFVLEYATNARSTLSFVATASSGTLVGLEPVTLNPPSFSNETTGLYHAEMTFEPSGNWTSAEVSVQAFLTPESGGPSQAMGAPVVVMLEAPEDHHDTSSSSASKSSPAPVAAFVLVGLALLAAVARRNA